MSGRPWFRSRKFGWGWRPASWQGWLIAGAAVAIVAAAGFIFRIDSLLGIVVVLTYMAALAVILFIRGGPGQ